MSEAEDRNSRAVRLPAMCPWRITGPTIEEQRQDVPAVCCSRELLRTSDVVPLCLDMDLTDEVYRYAWFSSFDGDLVVKVSRLGDGCMVDVERKWFVPPYVPQRKLGPSDWLHLERAVSAAAFWSLPRVGEFLVGFDGADWRFEGRKGDLFHSVSRWSPNDPGLLALGKAFAELAGFPDLRLY